MMSEKHPLDALAEALRALTEPELNYLMETSLRKARLYRDASEKDMRKHINIYDTLKAARDSTRNRRERLAYGELRDAIGARIKRRSRGLKMADKIIRNRSRHLH